MKWCNPACYSTPSPPHQFPILPVYKIISLSNSELHGLPETLKDHLCCYEVGEGFSVTGIPSIRCGGYRSAAP